MAATDATGSRRRILRLHAGLAVATVLCSSAFVVEVLRALGGNTLSWAYVFEWPALLAYGVYMWRRLLREERGLDPPRRDPSTSDAREDEALAAWNRYLAELHAAEAPARGDPEPSA